jgi:hypothetical protein
MRRIAAGALLALVLFTGQAAAMGISTTETQNVNGLRACSIVAEAKALGVSTTRIPVTRLLCQQYRLQVLAHGGY